MKIIVIFFTITLFTMAGCGGNKQLTDDFISVDVTKRYPKKELILQDFMDVEYIALETIDDFLTEGWVWAAGKDYIVARNLRSRDGNLYIFDRNGKGVQKINRWGQGPEEYTFINNIILDEDNYELFVSNREPNKIQVYDVYGRYKRTLQPENRFLDVSNFNKENLICEFRVLSNDNHNDQPSFFIMSKKDGSIVKEIHIQYKERKLPRIQGNGGVVSFGYPSIIPDRDGKILTQSSSDTVLRLLPDYNIVPFIVRTPSIQSMNPEVFLFPRMITDRYYFMDAVKREYDFVADDGFPKTTLMHDRQTKTIHEYTLYNNDYSGKVSVNLSIGGALNSEIAFCQIIDAYTLVEALEKGQLKEGKLKEIAAKLDVEDNPVIMLIKHKM